MNAVSHRRGCQVPSDVSPAVPGEGSLMPRHPTSLRARRDEWNLTGALQTNWLRAPAWRGAIADTGISSRRHRAGVNSRPGAATKAAPVTSTIPVVSESPAPRLNCRARRAGCGPATRTRRPPVTGGHWCLPAPVGRRGRRGLRHPMRPPGRRVPGEAQGRALRVLTAKGAPSDFDGRVTKLPSTNHKVPIIRRSDAMHL
jgi:hypothetical protein